MWILHLLPDGILEFVVNAVLLLGIILSFLSFFILNRILRFIPVLSNYITPIQIVSVLILSAGLYFKGGYSTEMIWREEVRVVKEELERAKNKAAEVVIQIEEKIVFKDRIVKEKGEEIIKYIETVVQNKEEIIKYIENCPVPTDLIDMHNEAAKINEAAKGRNK